MSAAKEPIDSDQGTRYEDLVDRLESIVDQIERGDLDLEGSIKGYEEGMGIIKRAREILDRAEQRVAALEARTGESADESSE